MSDKQPEGAGESGEFKQPSVPDDVWERFARDTERDIRSSAPKEPSARARMVTERLRQKDAKGAQPEGWRTGPAWREMDGRAARRRRLWAILGVPVAIAVALVAVKPSLLPGDPFGTSSGASAGTPSGGASAAALPAETAPPTAAPSSAAPDTPTLDRPFAGSPAERWADGAAAIVVPKATPVGTFTSAQVAAALKQAKTLLVGANLAPGTLRGERPESALAVLDPKQPRMLDDVNSWLRAPGKKHDPLMLFSRFDPAEVRPAGDVVKVRGRTTFKAGAHASVAIHMDYTFVYPLIQASKASKAPGTTETSGAPTEGSGGGSTEVARTIVRRVLDLELLDPRKYQATPGKLSITRYDQDLGNTACDVYDGFLHPQFDSAAPTGAPPTGPTTDPYDRSRAIEHSGTETCGTVSRT
ncbi:hypothetical protein FNV64_34030 [Streptomyces sp. S1A1-7]|uniref:hypothetical protein n=1 Tax=Streptomyces sp. S1A1-7 TaxID=2594459 RepID=UPI0011637758|nr:hypothetical protein [Streptomyces sp. S1A1-7]QDN79919.1 hypothetical protein FNV64_34030 [Streptomyces sp. S1A1-7]